VYDVIIVGAGAAGLTAGIYASRSGLDVIVLEMGISGGQASTAPLVENYPGYESISGAELMEKMKKQCSKNAEIWEGRNVIRAKTLADGFGVECEDGAYESRAIIIATGARLRKLGVKGEEELLGRGVCYCATCDGFFFKGKEVIIVGGGNKALNEALYLYSIGVKPKIIHRRDKLRADKVLQESVFSKEIEVIYNSQVKEIRGDEKVRSVIITREGNEEEIPTYGIFVSIGEEPNNEIAGELGVKMDGRGYIEADISQRTDKKMVYAAGDVTTGVKQIVVACSQGALAGLSAYIDLRNPYWSH